MKKKLLTFALISIMALSFTACSSKKEEAKTSKAETENGVEKPSESKPGSSTATTDEQQILDEATKSSMKQFVEQCIDDTYKSSAFYTCDILSPTEGTGGIVSLQIEDPSFTDSNACTSVIKNIIGKMLGDANYSNINSFQFNMLADSQVKFVISVDDAQAITTVDDIDSHIDAAAF